LDDLPECLNACFAPVVCIGVLDLVETHKVPPISVHCLLALLVDRPVYKVAVLLAELNVFEAAVSIHVSKRVPGQLQITVHPPALSFEVVDQVHFKVVHSVPKVVSVEGGSFVGFHDLAGAHQELNGLDQEGKGWALGIVKSFPLIRTHPYLLSLKVCLNEEFFVQQKEGNIYAQLAVSYHCTVFASFDDDWVFGGNLSALDDVA
jgi:hypothetical protein